MKLGCNKITGCLTNLWKSQNPIRPTGTQKYSKPVNV